MDSEAYSYGLSDSAAAAAAASSRSFKSQSRESCLDLNLLVIC